MIAYNVSNFLNLEIFKKEYFYKIKIMGFREFESKTCYFADIYIESHKRVFIIMASKSKIAPEFNINIQELENIWDLKLHNVCFEAGENKLLDITYYLPRKIFVVEDVSFEKDGTFECLETNAFKIINPVIASIGPIITYKFDKRSFKKCTSYDFLEKYYKEDKDYEHVKYRIKENDDFTRKV